MQADQSEILLPLVKWTHRIFSILSVLLVSIAKVPVLSRVESLNFVGHFVDTNGYWLLPAILLVIPGLEWVRRKLESVNTWRIVEAILEDFRNKVFDDKDDDPLHHHRVTLFKKVTCSFRFRRWPFSGWLIPVARSCHTTRRNASRFLAPDDADRAEGVAGNAWTRKKMFVVENLPDLSQESPEFQFNDYAEKSRISVSSVKKGLPRARSLCGFPIRVAGAQWGVIVIDSRDPVLDLDKVRAHYETSTLILQKLLEKLKP